MADDRYRLEDFELYKIARGFRRRAYALAQHLPPAEKFCLNPQLRRAALSVSNNIAEGHGRWYFQDNARFCRISRGSVEEIIDDINVCIDESYGRPEDLDSLRDEAYFLIARINAYIAYLYRTRQGS